MSQGQWTQTGHAATSTRCNVYTMCCVVCNYNRLPSVEWSVPSPCNVLCQESSVSHYGDIVISERRPESCQFLRTKEIYRRRTDDPRTPDPAGTSLGSVSSRYGITREGGLLLGSRLRTAPVSCAVLLLTVIDTRRTAVF